MGSLSHVWELINMYIPIERAVKMTPSMRDWTVSLDAAGLVALADLTTVSKRTALTGTSTFLDALVLSPGLHKQQNAPELNGGEYPACSAMTTGYVFRVENQATVQYLQKVGRTAHLTTLEVMNLNQYTRTWQKLLAMFYDFRAATWTATAAYMTAVALTVVIMIRQAFVQDWWAVAALAMLITARAINMLVLRHRSTPSWFGAPEPGEKSDLLVLLSQDRWIRIQGATDDVKAITAGQWLQEPTFFQSSLIAFATLLVYLDAALAGNAKQEGKLLLLVLLFTSVALLGLANHYTNVLTMHGRLVKVKGQRIRYKRRLDLAQELMAEFKRTDCFVGMGMVTPDKAHEIKKSYDKAVTM